MSPDARLAERIVERLLASRLVVAADAPSVREGLAAGDAPKAQWQEWAEAAERTGPGPTTERTE